MGLQPFHGQCPHQLLCTGSWIACGNMAISGIPSCLNYSEAYTQFSNVAAGHMT